MTFLSGFDLSKLGGGFPFLLGTIWGSFFNVCIYRLPEEQSVIWNRSHCRSCKTPLLWYHNIPVVSFFLLKGKCAFCSHKISFQYPFVELFSGLLFLSVWWVYGWSWQCFFYTVFLSFLFMITLIDLRHMIIPDELSLTGCVLGFLACFFTKDISWVESLLGLALGGGIFLGIATLYEKFTRQEGLGGGDIKLLAMIGAWLGYQSVLVVIVISSALGSVLGMSLMAFKKRNLKTAIPFGPFLAFGAMIYLFWGTLLRNIFFPSMN